MDNQNKNAIKVFVAFIAITAVFLFGFVLGSARSKSALAAASSNLLSSQGQALGDADMTLFWEVWQQIEAEYIESNVDEQSLVYGAAKGLVSGLDDKYTAFLTPEETEQYFDTTSGKFEGIGATLSQDGDYVAVESPIDQSPAQKVGLLNGDLILEVDGASMQGKNVYEVAALIRGEAGTKVSLSLFRESTNATLEVEIVRAKIDIKNIEVNDLGNGVFEVKIYRFTEASLEEFITSWDRAVAQMEGAEVVIIDLNNNPGGYVDGVEYVLADFLRDGTITFQEESKNGTKQVHKVTRKGKLTDVPVIVTVNSGSASAAEIFAAAIQDNERGIVIGEKTVGKGVEQKLIPLSDGSMLQLVFQRWLTPSGRQISADSPVTPDFLTESYEEQQQVLQEQLAKLNK